jgi:hypothetical protein
LGGVSKEGKGVVTARVAISTGEKLREFGTDYADERSESSSEDCPRKAV